VRLVVGKYGAIRWPADTDKASKEWVTPINAATRATIDQILATRPGIGPAYDFPATRGAGYVSRWLASHWLMRAERLAKVPKLDGSLWHCFRRKWATERKGLPGEDVAAAGGWSTPAVVQGIYQPPTSPRCIAW
jgi:integrase